MLEDRLWKCWKRKTSQIAATTFSDPLHHVLDTLDCPLRRARSASRSKPSPKAVAGRRKSAEAVDESETGSANFFWSSGEAARPPKGGPGEGVWETGWFTQGLRTRCNYDRVSCTSGLPASTRA